MIRGIAEGAQRTGQGKCCRVTSQRTLKQRVSFKEKKNKFFCALGKKKSGNVSTEVWAPEKKPGWPEKLSCRKRVCIPNKFGSLGPIIAPKNHVQGRREKRSSSSTKGSYPSILKYRIV